MGLESHVDRVLMEKRLMKGNDYRWENGLKPIGFGSKTSRDVAERIMKVLDRSDEFGPTRYNEKKNEIEFGTFSEYFDGDLSDYAQYCEDFKNFVDDEGEKLITRQEHLEWCKKRALEYCDVGDLQGAFASIASDLSKHEETKGHMGLELGMGLLMTGGLNTAEKMRKFIEEFN
jgi:hypothetical protein